MGKFCCTNASGRASASAGPCAGDQVQVLLHNHMVSWPSASESSGKRAQVLNMKNVNMCKWVANTKTSGREKERALHRLLSTVLSDLLSKL